MSDDRKRSTGSTAGGGIGFCGLLTIAFIVLKLTHVINWSWFWVLSPLIFSVGLVVFILVFLILVLIIVGIIKGIMESL